MQIQTTDKVKVSTHCLVYGPPKSGKTRLIPTCPAPIVCDTDDGLSSVRQHSIPFVKCRSWAEVQEFVRWVLGSKETKDFKTVIYDDFTEMAELFLMAEKPKHKNLMQAYGELNDTMMAFIRDMRKVEGKHIVFICKQDRIQDMSTGALIYAPYVPGKAIPQMLPYLLGEVYHMETWTNPQDQSVYEVLRCKANVQFSAGSRSGKLNDLEMADLGAIFQKIVS